jgi:putative DNA primase/helicase
MVNLAGDIGFADLKDTSMFKGLTGRDLITAKRKYLKALSFENYAKFVFACNELPKVYDLSKGFWDRWVLLEFPYYFADKELFDTTPEQLRKNWKIRDENIIDKIATDEQLSGLLNAFLDGLDRLVKNKKFSCTLGSEEVKNLWIRKSDSFQAFCMDNLEEDYQGVVTKKDIRSRFAKYCKKHKLKSASDKAIKVALETNYGASEGRKEISDGYWDHVWEGLRWKSSIC